MNHFLQKQVVRVARQVIRIAAFVQFIQLEASKNVGVGHDIGL